MNKIKSFRDLNIWKKGIEIAEKTYQFTSELPKDEQFGLVSQMRCAAISLPSNAAEGFRRRSNREFRQFLHIALGSAAELETILNFAKICTDSEAMMQKNFLICSITFRQ
jgi:four helix bundle protein